MKTRLLHPSFFTDAKVSLLSPDARFLLLGLWLRCDDYGRAHYLPKLIAGEVFPYDQVAIEPLLGEIIGGGFIRIYQAGSETFYDVPNWDRWQKPKYKAKSTIPPFEETNGIGRNFSQLRPESGPSSPESGPSSPESGESSLPISVSVSVSELELLSELTLTRFLTPDELLERWASVQNLKPIPRWIRRWRNAATEFLEQHPDLTATEFDAFAAWATERGVAVPGGWASWWPAWPGARTGPPARTPDPNCAHCYGKGIVYWTDSGENSENVDGYNGPLTPQECKCLQPSR